MNAMIDGEYPEDIAELTEQQKRCLRLVNKRYTSKTIATQLGLSPYTVDNHLKAALHTVGSTSRHEVARWLASYENRLTNNWSDQSPVVDKNQAPGASSVSPLDDVEPEFRNETKEPSLDVVPIPSRGAFPSQRGVEDASSAQTHPSIIFFRRLARGFSRALRFGARGNDHPGFRGDVDAQIKSQDTGHLLTGLDLSVTQHGKSEELRSNRRYGGPHVLSQAQKLLVIIVSAFALMIIMIACLTILDELSRLCSRSPLCSGPVKVQNIDLKDQI